MEQLERGGKRPIRPEQKPVLLLAELIHRFTAPYQTSERRIVMDFFGGTGMFVTAL